MCKLIYDNTQNTTVLCCLLWFFRQITIQVVHRYISLDTVKFGQNILKTMEVVWTLAINKIKIFVDVRCIIRKSIERQVLVHKLTKIITVILYKYRGLILHTIYD